MTRTLRKTSISLAVFLAFASFFAAKISAETKEFLSQVYKIDKIYKSMEGPQSSQQVTLLDGPPELVWITGFRTDMVGADGKTPSLPEFMCHMNLDFNPGKHQKLLGSGTHGNGRIMTLSQGQIDVKFPEGFGMPVLSNEQLSLNTQVLNHNLEKPQMEVRHKVTFDFLKDRDLKKDLKPLFNTSVFGMKLLEGKDGHFGIAEADESKHGPSCLPGDAAPNAHGGSVYNDSFQRKFSGHWVVKPGREENHTNVTRYLNLPYDTTLHYAAVHLHPYSESLELKDLTTGKTVFKSKARGFKDKIGLTNVSDFSSSKGVPMYKNHEYDLISVYNNTMAIDTDSMAVMLLFLHDKKFQKSTVVIPSTASAPVREKAVQWKDQRVLLKTSLGDLVIALDPVAAPVTVTQFMELVKAGAYDGVDLAYVAPNFLAQFNGASHSTLNQRVPLEAGGIKHVRGVLSLARDPQDPNSGQSSFCILFNDAPHLDGQYTAFGMVEKGMETLSAIENTPRDDKNRPLKRIQLEKATLINTRSAARLKLTSAPLPVAPPIEPIATDVELGKLRLKTTLGEMIFTLYPNVAPQTVAQILRLARAGVYDSVRIFRVEPGFVAQISSAHDRKTPLTSAQQVLLRKIPAEFSVLRHHRGYLSMAREDNDVNSAESSFSILLGDAPHLDGKYTIFGEMESGSNVLSAIEKAPRKGNAPIDRIDVLKADTLPIRPN